MQKGASRKLACVSLALAKGKDKKKRKISPKNLKHILVGVCNLNSKTPWKEKEISG
jgi:hypothetical protein